MIEAVSSSLVNAQVLRNSAGRAEAGSTTAVEVDITSAPQAPQAPYISPHIAIDLDHNKAVIQIRDSDTGDVQNQFPSESRLVQLSRAEAQRKTEELQKPITSTPVETQQTTVSAPQQAAAPEVAAVDVVTVQEVTSASSANSPIPSPQIAVQALSAGAQSGQPQASGGVSVIA